MKRKQHSLALAALALLTVPGMTSSADAVASQWLKNSSYFAEDGTNTGDAKTRIVIQPNGADLGGWRTRLDVQGTNVVALGDVYRARTNSIVIGNQTWGAQNAVSMGFASVSTSQSVTLGNFARNLSGGQADGAKSVSLGYNTTTGADQSVALGSQVFAGRQATAIGNDTFSLGEASISIGSDDIQQKYKDRMTDSDINKYYGDMFNDKRLVYMRTVFWHGDGMTMTGPSETAALKQQLRQQLGENWETDLYSSTPAVIDKVYAAHTNFINQGNKSLVSRAYTGESAVFSPNLARGTGSIAIGSRALGYADGSTALGTLAFALGEGSTAIGLRSRAEGENSIAVGEKTVVFGDAAHSLAMGNQIQVQGTGATGVGNKAFASGKNSLAFGTNVYANTELKDDKFTSFVKKVNIQKVSNQTQLMAFVERNKPEYKEGEVYQTYSIVKNGKEEKVELKKAVPTKDAENSVAIGNYGVANGNNSIAAGFAAVALGNNSASYGTFAYAEGKNSSAFGVSAKATMDDSLALGTSSETDYTTEEMSATPYIPNLNVQDPEDAERLKKMVQGNAKGIISVGKKKEERRITNLAPGAVDTDAVNVSQLKALVAGIKNGKLFTDKGENPGGDNTATPVWGSWQIGGKGLGESDADGLGTVDTKANTVKFVGRGAATVKVTRSTPDESKPGEYTVTVDVAQGGTGAKGEKGDKGDKGDTGKSAYEIWKAQSGNGDKSEVDFLNSLKGAKGEKGDTGTAGAKGADGKDGKDGKSAYDLWKAKPENSNKSEEDFLKALKGEKGDAGTAGAKGADGKSAYEIWKAQSGNDGKSEQDFLTSLKGADGKDGKDGKSAYDLWKAKPENSNKSEEDFLKGLKGADGKDGKDGKSAYDLWKAKPENSNKSEEDFLKALKGEKGDAGTAGAKGADGKSAYEIWKAQSGNDGKSEQDFLTSLKGADGKDGKDGKSAYDLWKAKPENSGKSEDDFLKGLKGADGKDGKSAYDLWKAKPENSGKSEDDFLKGLKGADGKDGKSAYEVWKAQSGNADKTEADFLNSLKGMKGDKGEAGKSAYETWKETAKPEAGKDSQADFLKSLKGEKGDKGENGAKGKDGRGISSTGVDGAGNLVINYTDGTKEHLSVGAGSGQGNGGALVYVDGKGQEVKPAGDGTYVPASAVKAADGKYYPAGTQLGADGMPPAGAEALSGVDGKNVSTAVKAADGTVTHPERVGNVADGVKDTDATNVKQLKDATKPLREVIEAATDKDGSPIDDRGNKLVKDTDGKYYPDNGEGKPDRSKGAVQPATRLKGITFSTDKGDVRRSLGEVVKMTGSKGQGGKVFASEGYSDRNTAAMTDSKGNLHLMFSEKPTFKGLTVEDGSGRKTDITPGSVNVSDKAGNSSDLSSVGLVVAAGPKGEKGSAHYGADGVVYETPDGKGGHTTTVLMPDGKGGLTLVSPGQGRAHVLTDRDVHGLIGQANSAFNTLNGNLQRVGAISSAMSALVPLDYDEEHPTTVSAGYGHYGDANALALGVMHYLDRDMLLNAGVSYAGEGDVALRVGASLRVGSSPKYENRRVSTNDYTLLKKVEQQADKLSAYEEALSKQNEINRQLMKEIEELKKKIR